MLNKPLPVNAKQLLESLKEESGLYIAKPDSKLDGSDYKDEVDHIDI